MHCATVNETYTNKQFLPSPSSGNRDHGDAQLAELERIILERNVRTLFQPIFDLRNNRIYGYEALTRGPDGSPLQMPELLFDIARKHNRLFALEGICREIAIKSFIRLDIKERLFLNADPRTLMDPSFREGVTMGILQREGLPADRVVIELTENTPVVEKIGALKQAVTHYREMGFTIAMDDLSAGYSNLQLMAELRPEYIKLDKYFTQKLPDDGVAREFVRTISNLAKHMNCTIIAEGIETPAIIREVQKLGLHLGQGYLLGKPTDKPDGISVKMLQEAFSHIESSTDKHTDRESVTCLIRKSRPAAPEDASEGILDMFQRDSSLLAIPVLNNGLVVGMVLREEIQQSFSQRFGRELHGHRPIRHLMWKEPLVVRADMPVDELSCLVTNRSFTQLYTPVIVEDNHGYAGLVFVHDLLEHITQNRIELAMNANPLTRLPGNIAIEQEITRRLRTSQPFVLCYIDLDNFKAFNDRYGYKHGDAMLQLLGDTIKLAASPQDFAGHIGGDDFILIIEQHEAWENQLYKLMQAFSSRSTTLYDAADVNAGGIISKNRNGEVRKVSLTALSIGALPCPPGCFSSHLEVAEVASELKCKAKKTAGNCLEVDRRSHSVTCS